MSALSSLLVQDQVLSVTQVEQALQRQVIFGGDLATNLLELGLVDEDVLAEYIGRVVRLPVLSRAALENIDPRVLKTVPPEVARDHQIVPVRLQGNALLVACAGPPPSEALERISRLASFEVTPRLALEFRLAMALNRYYGVPLSARMAALQRRFQPDFEVDAEPAEQPRPEAVRKEDSAPVWQREAPVVEPQPPLETPIVIEPSRPVRQEGESTIKFVTAERRGRSGEDTSPFGRPAARPARRLAEKEPVEEKKERGYEPRRLRFSEAVRELESAEGRDEILDLLLAFAGQAFDYTALLVVQGKTAHGRSAVFRGRPPYGIEDVEVSLERSGMFNTVFVTRGYHLGPPGDHPADAEVLARLQREPPRSCTVIPVFVRQRLILMLYGDSGREGVRANRVAKLAEFCREVGRAFERILLKKKLGAFREGDDRSPAKVSTDRPAEVGSERKAAPEMSQWKPAEPDSEASLSGKIRRSQAGFGDGDVIGEEGWPEPSISSIPAPAAEKEQPPAEETGAEPTLSEVESRPTQPSESSPFEPPTEGDGGPGFDPLRAPPQELLERVEYIERVSADYLTPEDRPTPVPEAVEAVESEEAGPGDPPAPPPDAVAARAVVRIDQPAPAAEPEPEPRAAEPAAGAAPVAETRSVVVEMTEEIDELVDRVTAGGGFDEKAALTLVQLGDDALARLVERFPGPLSCDRYQEVGRSRPVEQHGPLLRALATFGSSAGPRLVPLLDSMDSEVRYYATFMFTSCEYPEALGSLVQRIFDNDRQIRSLAVDVIAGYGETPEYRWAMRELAGTLTAPSSSLEKKRIAAGALGALKAPEGVSALADLLGSVDSVLAERCHDALVRITFNDFGFSERRWMAWWSSNRSLSRLEWAIESLNHRLENVRLAAVDELRRATADAVEWPAGALDHKQRREMARRLREWWKREGRALHPVPSVD
ncbi:MAG: hypothetical protein R6V85_19810 [Polyangia bacterium]